MTVGAYWARNLASGSIRWHRLSQPVTGPFRHHARSGDDSRGYEVAPPAGLYANHPRNDLRVRE
jgi:hypothetical protein